MPRHAEVPTDNGRDPKRPAVPSHSGPYEGRAKRASENENGIAGLSIHRAAAPNLVGISCRPENGQARGMVAAITPE